MEGRVRSHRRGPGRVAGVVTGVLLLAGCLLYAVVRAFLEVAIADLTSRPGWLRGWLVPAAVVVLCLVTAVVRKRLGERRLARVRRSFDRWQGTSGWVRGSVDRIWPWTTLIRAPDMVTVVSAFDGELTGHPVTVGEVSWIDNGLGQAVDRWSGHGIFTVVRLPGSPPDCAVRRFRMTYRQRAGEDAFRRRFRVITKDAAGSRCLGREGLRQAHVNDEIPPWTLLGGELFTITPIDKVATPAAMESAASRTMRVIELIGLCSD